jgi:hypothetical protein
MSRDRSRESAAHLSRRSRSALGALDAIDGRAAPALRVQRRDYGVGRPIAEAWAVFCGQYCHLHVILYPFSNVIQTLLYKGVKVPKYSTNNCPGDFGSFFFGGFVGGRSRVGAGGSK